MIARATLMMATSLLLAGLLASPAARAEVRLVQQGDRQVKAKILPSRSGIWGVSEEGLDPKVLNPEGDLWGDSLPQLKESEQDVTAAWFRHATGEVLLARGGARGWSAPSVLRVGRPVGMPRILELDSGTLVAWQEREEPGHALAVLAAFVNGTRVGEATELAEGQLLEAWSVAGAAHVLVAEPLAGGGYEIVLHVSPDPPIIPIGIRRIGLDLRSNLPQSAPLLTGLAGQAAADDGPHAAYWWSSPTELSVLKFDELSGEPILPVETRVDPKGRNMSTGWLKQVLHDLR